MKPKLVSVKNWGPFIDVPRVNLYQQPKVYVPVNKSFYLNLFLIIIIILVSYMCYEIYKERKMINDYLQGQIS